MKFVFNLVHQPIINKLEISPIQNENYGDKEIDDNIVNDKQWYTTLI